MTPFYALLIVVVLVLICALHLAKRGQLILRPKPQPAKPKEPTP